MDLLHFFHKLAALAFLLISENCYLHRDLYSIYMVTQGRHQKKINIYFRALKEKSNILLKINSILFLVPWNFLARGQTYSCSGGAQSR